MELYLDFNVSIGSNQSHGPGSGAGSGYDGFIEGLFLEGAKMSADGSVGPFLDLSEELKTRLPLSKLQWRQRSVTATSSPAGSISLQLPIYLDDSRSQSVAVVHVLVNEAVPRTVWAQRGVALVLQNVV